MNNIDNKLQGLNDLTDYIFTIIRNEIRAINTTFPAIVTHVNENKVNIQSLCKLTDDDEPAIINNVMIAQPYTQSSKVHFKVDVGDIGLAFVCQNDISTVKYNSTASVVNTKRTHDINDAVFMPCSLYNQLLMDTDEFKIEGDSIIMKAKKVIIEAEGSDGISFKTPVGSYADVVSLLKQLFTLITSGMVGSGTNPAAYNAASEALWKQIESIMK